MLKVVCALLKALIVGIGFLSTSGTGDPVFAENSSMLRLRLASWPESFHPLATANGDTHKLFSLLHAPLVKYSSREVVEPYVAQKWSFSQDRTQLRITLNPSLTFSSGQKLDAADVHHTFQLLQDPQSCPYCPQILPAAVKVEKSSSPAQLVLVFDAAVSHQAALKALSLIPILPRSVAFSAVEKLSFKDKLKQIVGAGPYEIDVQNSEYRKHILLKRRSAAHLSLLKEKDLAFKRLYFKYIESDRVAYDSLLKKHLHVLSIPPHLSTPPAQWTDSELKIWSHELPPGRNVVMALWNTQRGPMKDLDFRKILSELMDPRRILEEFFPQSLYAPLAHPAELFGETWGKKRRALGALAQRLRSLGYEGRNLEGARLKKNADGSETAAELTLVYSHKIHGAWLQKLRKTAKSLGVLITPRFVPLSVVVKLIEERNFEGALLSAAHLYKSSQLWELGSPLYDSGLESDVIKKAAIDDASKVQRAALKALVDSYVAVFLFRQTSQRWGYYSGHVKPPSWARTTSWSQVKPTEIWKWQPGASS